jgi:hypothetical protein
MIKPTIGRVVWFRPIFSSPEDQPMAAIVTYIHNDRLINVAVFGPYGGAQGYTSIRLVQEGDNRPIGENYAEWMPYQIGQAKKETTQ